jgi:hypothetical protein
LSCLFLSRTLFAFPFSLFRLSSVVWALAWVPRAPFPARCTVHRRSPYRLGAKCAPGPKP